MSGAEGQTAGLLGVELANEVLARAAGLPRTSRAVLGIVGAPGSGKTTLARAMAADLCAAGLPCCVVPMDGFHLADVELVRLGRLQRKGAIETFDGFGYLNLLRRCLEETNHTIYAPAFDREIEQPVAGAIAVVPGCRLIIAEGNYLLDEAEPWPRVRDLLAESWFCLANDASRRAWLERRHIAFGKTPEAAANWVAQVDQPNAVRVVARQSLATRVLPMIERIT
ncbi:MAG: nucleoside/nucleotide kinase family protein [Micrococcales bacterium]|nr:nucleoside/nucleotide kinase family protein [Micrococcales bacterium]